jgi:short-subunit dehydrogenase
LPVAADITIEADRQRLLEASTAHFGGLDVLVNNAGVGASGHFSDCSDSILRQIMEVNFFAAAELIRLAVPSLANGDEPAIVNVSSMCGRRGIPAWSEYSASKFALVGLTESIRAELKSRYDIDVLLILPGMTASNLNRNLLRSDAKQKLNFAAAMPTADVAEVIWQALRQRRRETVIGWDARWILRVNRWLPWLVDRLLIRKVRKLWATPTESPVRQEQHVLSSR